MPHLLPTYMGLFLTMQLLRPRVAAAAGTAVVVDPPPAVIVFGDSTADTGNNNFIQTLLRANYTPYGRDFSFSPGAGVGVATGRFSNGRLAADFVSQALGLPRTVPPYLDPAAHSILTLASGVSFASAGSGLDDITAQIFSAVTLPQQIEHFKEYTWRLRRALGTAAAADVISRSLYLISAGAGDFLGNYLLFPLRRYHYTLPEYESFLVGAAEAAVRAVHAQGGARRVRLAGLPPLGCLPLRRTLNLAVPGECDRRLNAVARRFNRRLSAMAARLSTELPGKVVYVDVYRVLAEVIEKPWAYGFEDAVRGCCGMTGFVEAGVLCGLETALTCQDADKYVFFDAVHLSQKAYRIIADAIVHANATSE